jgi:23S rRNA (cytidine1920-2'-O)/16S rRNA (cytidine1409-2'-O)-methyltransferase
VAVRERTNVRSLQPDDVPQAPSLVVADLSFIPLELVLPALAAVSAPDVDMLLMVKPQFEVGRAAVGDGVVRDPELRRSAVRGVADAAVECGLTVAGVAASPLPGPSGNVEYFLWLRRSSRETMAPEGLLGTMLDQAIADAVEKGPQ